MKDEFLGTAAHDLKSPLSSILLSVDMLENHLDAGRMDRLRETTARIRNRVYWMRDLITDLLDIARLETGQGMEREVISLAAILEEARSDNARALEAREQTLDIDLPPDDLSLQADPHQLKRMFDNLLSNAIKFTPQGGTITVGVSAEPGTLTITVGDTGIGIDPADLSHIFDRFFRATSARDRGIEGTGLGLAIVQAIVEQHGGEITVSSEAGAGTTFSITLPRI